MSEDELMEASISGRIDARRGLPVDPYYVSDPDDCSAEAQAYLRAYGAERKAAASVAQTAG